MNKFIVTFLTASAIGLAAPVMAQDAPAPAPEAPAPEAPAAQTATAKAGDTVYDPAGQPAATIESIDGANAVLSTGTLKASVPLSEIGSGPNGPMISMSKLQLEAAIRGATK